LGWPLSAQEMSLHFRRTQQNDSQDTPCCIRIRKSKIWAENHGGEALICTWSSPEEQPGEALPWIMENHDESRPDLAAAPDPGQGRRESSGDDDDKFRFELSL
jgi:hypothetical protein